MSAEPLRSGPADGVQVRGLRIAAGGRLILRGVDLDAVPGELVGLIGPNGAGKTTLLRAVAGYLPADAGQVRIGGADPRRLRARDLGRLLAQVPQAASLDLDFSCLDIVLMGRYPHLRRLQRHEGPEDLTAARLALAAAGLGDREGDPAAVLSGGERQLLLLARALAQDAAVLLLDEPTANLDLRHRLAALDLVRSAVGVGIAGIAAVHDLELAARYCDRLVLVADGAVLATGRPAEVLTPERIDAAFGVTVEVFQDPVTRALRLSVLGRAR
jgi:iron complex transport system ATP-binding protein